MHRSVSSSRTRASKTAAKTAAKTAPLSAVLALSALLVSALCWPAESRAQTCPKDVACEDMTDPPCDVMDQVRCWEGLRNRMYQLCTYRGGKCTAENVQEFHRVLEKLGELGGRMEAQIQPE